MFTSVRLLQLAHRRDLSRSMFRDRALQFVERHRWNLTLLGDGLEIDEYDDELATYCIVEESGRHLASVRLRPAGKGCMVEKYFPLLWNSNGARLERSVEITRFCASPSLSADDRIAAISDLLLGLCRHCQRTGIDRFFGVVFPQAARVIRQAGWAPHELCRTSDSQSELILAEWSIEPLTSWTIQERREFREDVWRRRARALPETLQRDAA